MSYSKNWPAKLNWEISYIYLVIYKKETGRIKNLNSENVRQVGAYFTRIGHLGCDTINFDKRALRKITVCHQNSFKHSQSC